MDLPRNLSEATRHIAHRVQRPIEKTQKNITRAASFAIASLQRVKEFPVATTDRSGWTQCQAEKTGDIEQTNA